jgi:predicted dehydrogenase
LDEKINVKDEDAIEAELKAFRDAIVQDKRPPVNEIDGYIAMEVAHEILKKIASSQPNL